jgi:hypothetical protein
MDLSYLDIPLHKALLPDKLQIVYLALQTLRSPFNQYESLSYQNIIGTGAVESGYIDVGKLYLVEIRNWADFFDTLNWSKNECRTVMRNMETNHLMLDYGNKYMKTRPVEKVMQKYTQRCLEFPEITRQVYFLYDKYSMINARTGEHTTETMINYKYGVVHYFGKTTEYDYYQLDCNPVQNSPIDTYLCDTWDNPFQFELLTDAAT